MKECKEYRVEIRCQNGKTITVAVPANGEELIQDGAVIRVEEHTLGILQTASLCLNLKDEDSWTNCGLEKDAPVRVFVPMEPMPRNMTALYLFSPWWTRPAFVERFEDIPPLTQVLFLQYEDYCACLVPMVGEEWKVTVNGGTETELCLELSAGMGGAQEVDEPIYLLARGATAFEAARHAFSHLAQKKGILLREQRRIPEQFRYLGWCSWNAFYTDVDEKGIRQKAAELTEKSVPVRWMLIDDGWMSTQGRYLTAFAPDGGKFPHGFRSMIEDLRSTSCIQHFGVWHAFGGYWNGVKGDSKLAQEQARHLIRTVSGALVPSPETGADFYHDWYLLLKEEGIDFVKVDGQSTAAIYYENTRPVASAVQGMNQQLEKGALLMDNSIINCMGMAMENVLARPMSALSRNSDDFFPDREGSFAEHLLENAYNSLYHDQLYCCDWDMFWTSHPDCIKHSLLRAVSGGPIYISDRVGETDSAVLKPLTYLDGEILRMNRSARPTEDCVFRDPLKDGVLKLHNTASWGGETAGGIAVYNLTDAFQSFSFAPGDIPELAESEEYWIYDFFGKRSSVIRKGELFQGGVEAQGYGWYVVLPKRDTASCLGLAEKYAGFTAVEQVHEGRGQTALILRESGPVAWLSERVCSKVECNGEDVTAQVIQQGSLFTFHASERAEKMVLTLRW